MFNLADLKISIHALTKRATLEFISDKANYEISIHALTKRATGLSFLIIPSVCNFNPRSHEESDRNI